MLCDRDLQSDAAQYSHETAGHSTVPHTHGRIPRGYCVHNLVFINLQLIVISTLFNSWMPTQKFNFEF